MEFIHLGLLRYREALALQHELHQQCVLDRRDSCVLLVEHHPVITLGKHAEEKHLLVAREHLSTQGVDIIECDRGGQITAHMPGQLVVYPIFKLKENLLGVKRYINLLEEVVINTLDTFGISSARDKKNPGVWVQGKKICALGIRISQRVAMHGLALNVANDLSLFNAMQPCGLIDGKVTSMEQVSGEKIDLHLVAERFIEQFADCFNLGSSKVVKGWEKDLASDFDVRNNE